MATKLNLEQESVTEEIAGRKGSSPSLRLERSSWCNTICIYAVQYEWDESKNHTNQRKHGVSFELAALVFEDERCLIGPDRIDSTTGEQRWHAIGAVQAEPRAAAVLLVVHAYREDYYGEEIIRIISARAAEAHDIRRYQEQAVD